VTERVVGVFVRFFIASTVNEAERRMSQRWLINIATALPLLQGVLDGPAPGTAAVQTEVKQVLKLPIVETLSHHHSSNSMVNRWSNR
jgi:hypothetical protein